MKKIDIPIHLEIYFDDPEDINENLAELFNNSEFKTKIKTDLLERLEVAVKEKRTKVSIFRLAYYGVDLVVKKTQYKKLLNKVLEIYQEEEDYLKCVEIKNLIDQI